jgi:excisionase family DNA binding protein
MVNDGEITSAPKLLTTRELAQYLQMTVRTLRRHIDGGMPVIRMNRRVYRFDLVRVRAWLDEQS